MSHTIHAYLLINDIRCNQEWVFNNIRELFQDMDDIIFSKDVDPFDSQESLNLNLNSYWLTVFYDSDQQVRDDFNYLGVDGLEAFSRIRVIFGPDEMNAYDDIAVVIYDFLLNMENVLVYDVTQSEVIEK